MRTSQYRRHQRARIKQRRLNQFLTKGTSWYPVNKESIENSKNFKIAIDTPRGCSCALCSHDWYGRNSIKNLKKTEQSFLICNDIKSQLDDWYHALGE